MPGDTVRAEVYAKYLDHTTDNWTTALRNIIIALSGSANPGGTYVDGAAQGTIDGSFPYPDVLVRENDNGTGPKAYLNYILFDRNFTFLTGGFRRVTTDAREAGQGADPVNGVPHEHLYFDDIVIREPGYVYIYLSNENETPAEVFFDDFKVEHVKSSIVQQDDYYPFGLTFNSYWRENSVQQNHLYSGKERQDELGLEWLDYGARMYMSDIGRWGVIDPLSECDRRFSPYVYAFNNPVRYMDPDGMWAVDKKGNLSTSNTSEIEQFINSLTTGKVSTIHIQSVGKASQKDKDRNAFAVGVINDTFEGLGINLRASDVQYSDKVMTKDEFYSREGADENDSYVFIGNSSALKKAEVAAEAGGWETGMYNEQEYKDPGTTYIGGDNIHFINTVKMNYTIRQFFEKDDFGESAIENTGTRLAFTIMHETGHTKFKNHPSTGGVNGHHVPGTIMQALPTRNSKHDEWMLRRLRALHNRNQM